MTGKKFAGFEYRMTCDRHGEPGHTGHAYKVKVEKDGDLVAKLAKTDTDPVMGRPGNVGCVPWHGEARYVSPWRDDVAELEVQAERLSRPVTLFEVTA